MTNQRRAGLGRGLGALLPAAEEGGGVLEIEVDEIQPNPRQPRQEFSEEELEELATSIKEMGVLQPVIVRPREAGGYELLAGERRLRASRLAGVRRIPAVVRQADDREALTSALVENIQREDLQPLEEGQAYRDLIEVFDLTQEEVAVRVGKSRAHVANTIRLLELPEGVKRLLGEGLLTAGHARAILQIRDAAAREAAAKRVVDEGLTVRQIEALARKESEASGESRPSRPRTRRAKFPDLEEALSDRLGTMVAVEVGRGRGRIVIHFGSRDDLHRLAELLVGNAAETPED